MNKEKSPVPKWLRVIVPSLLIVVWFAVAGIGGPYFGKISSVASTDQSTFLPASAESTKVNEEIAKFQEENTIPALIAFEAKEGELSSETLAAIRSAAEPFNDFEGVNNGVSPPIVAEDKKAAFVVVNIASDSDYKKLVPEFKSTLDSAGLSGVTYAVTGPVGFSNDLAAAFSGIDELLLIVALAVVFVILLFVYKSPILPIVVLLNSVFALCAAILIVFFLAKAGIVTLNGQVQGILFILVIGAATDYALLFTARYREELVKTKEVYKAVLTSWKRSFEPIVAAGGTVIAGLLCLLLSDLNSNKALGPVGAIGISLAIIATLTLLPSLLIAFGRVVFWPRIPRYTLSNKRTDEDTTKKGIWPKVANLVKNNARTVWVTVALILVVSAFGVTQLRASGVPQSEFVLGSSEARDGQEIINKHFPGGSGTPAKIVASESKLDDVVAVLDKNTGVDSIAIVANNTPNGTMPIGEGSEEALRIPIYAQAAPRVIDGEVLIEATLTNDADSNEAQATVQELRAAVREVDPSAQIGGTTAVQLDTRISSERDRAVVIPAVLIVITVILMLLLRSILAPLILLVITTLSFASILGISALLFNGPFGFTGADPSVVLYGFIFLVALGIDYNIFLMTRVREESLKHGTRKGVLIGLVATGSVITSAGIVLAATFAALVVIPILFLVQLAFIVAFGVLVDAIVVRSLLVPALTHDIGKTIWWPSKKHKK